MKVSSILFEGFIPKYYKSSVNEADNDFWEERKKKQAKQLQDETEQQSEKRRRNDWDRDKLTKYDVGYYAWILFDWLVDNDKIEVLSQEEKQRIEYLRGQIKELQDKFDNSEDVEYDIFDTIGVYEEELDELTEDKKDVYDLVFDDTFYDMYSFRLLGEFDHGYAVGNHNDTEDSAKQNVREFIDENGVSSLNIDRDSFINKRYWRDWLEDFFSDSLYDDPEGWLPDSMRSLSDKQEEEIQWLFLQLRAAKKLNDDDLVDELQKEIDEIHEEPDGDFDLSDTNMISDIIENRVDEYENDFDTFMRDYGWDDSDEFLDRFIDIDEVVDHVVETDGFGMLSNYDGEVHATYYDNDVYYIILK